MGQLMAENNQGQPYQLKSPLCIVSVIILFMILVELGKTEVSKIQTSYLWYATYVAFAVFRICR